MTLHRLYHGLPGLLCASALASGSALGASSLSPAPTTAAVRDVTLAGAAPSASTTAPATTAPATTAPTTRPSPDEEMVSISFRDTPVEMLFTFISEKTGKPVIPEDSLRQKRITVISSRQRPLSQAMQIIQEALRQNGIVEEESPRVINMKSISEARQSMLQLIGPDQSVSSLPNKAQVVHKVFELRYFDVGKMKDVVLPMLPEFGHVMADPNTHRLMVTDTVEDLERIEQMINNLDVSQADQTIKKIIPVGQGDAADIVATVRVLIASSLGAEAHQVLTGNPPSRRDAAGGGAPSPSPMMSFGPMGGPPMASPVSSAAAAPAVFVEENKVPVVLLADVQRNWIIAVASNRVMALIEEWVSRLDVPPAPGESQFDVLEVQHADMDDLTRQVAQTIDALPTGDAQKSVRIVPFAQSRKILVTGSKRGREMVRQLLTSLDQEAGSQTMRVFPLQYADAEDVAANIQQLYGSKKNNDFNPFFFDFSERNRQPANVRVKVTADTRRNAIVVISDPAMLDEIGRLLKEQWDLPLSDQDCQPKIYTLKYVDPIKLKDMLEELFFKKKPHQSDSPYYIDRLLDMAGSQNDQPVGRLYGQFRFQAMPDSNRLLVIAKSSANYAVMDSLVAQLDQPEDAGIPQMIELKHANAEDLAEQLNATLSEPGTLAEVLRAKRELAANNRQSGPAQTSSNNTTNNNAGNSNTPQSSQNNSNPNVMTFWWQRAPERVDERPASNLIGKIRFVPVSRRNALLVVAPVAYMEPIHDLVEQLDQPGMQVVIHAVIAQVDSDGYTTLGMRLASNSSVFNDPRLMDSAMAGSSSITANKVISGQSGSANSTVFTGNLNVNFLLQLLIRNYGMKVLFEPRLFTADNQEAEFFDGQDVPYQSASQTSPEGAAITQSFLYTSVGTYLRIRPHITNQQDVDLTINLELSDVVQGETIFGNNLFDRQQTTTHVIIRDGQTVMLSGIIQQQDSQDVRKLPLLGDIPWLGQLFRSTDHTKTRTELVAFITPHVIRADGQPAASTSYQQWINSLRKSLNDGQNPATAPATEENK